MKTGFKDLDNVINLNEGELTVIAARPAMGKTTFALNIINNIVFKQNIPTLLFSLESSKDFIIDKMIDASYVAFKKEYMDSKEKIIDKMLSINSKIDAKKIERTKMNNNKIKIMGDLLTSKEQEQLDIYLKKLYNSKLFISDITYTIDNICKTSREFKTKKNIKIIVIDYLQLIEFDKEGLLNREDEILEILRKLEALAKELNIPIVITSQLPQKLELRENKRPIISDFGESKEGILKYNDKILFLYRDSYYDCSKASNTTEVIVAKNNDGITDTINLTWTPEYCIFENNKNN